LLSLRQFITDKSVHAGSILFLGALMNGRMVTGPEEPVIPPVPHFVMFEGGWEVFGVGTIYPGENGPHIHYHASVGRSGHALTGCLREKAITYLVVEAIVLEFTGLSARRIFDEKIQVHLPVLGKEEDITKDEISDAGENEEESPVDKSSDKSDEMDDLPGGLAEIIRDLTSRPSS
jgi:predicted DNA-binding protein with PD1-like motif